MIYIEKDLSAIQSRKWQLTINNPLEKGYTHEVIKHNILTLKSLRYYCLSDEVAKIHHTHIYILFRSPVRFSTLKRLFPEVHLEKSYGSSLENKNYVFKEGENGKKIRRKKQIFQIRMKNGGGIAGRKAGAEK